jgi:hypothetical protein
MRVYPVAHNVRQCKCADCKKTLEAGEGIQHTYPMFHGKGQFYYCCPPCDAAREITEQKIVDELKARSDGSEH